MRKRNSVVAKILAVILLVSFAQPADAAAVKAGGKCTALGATAVASGKTFNCIASGKKLVWDSGAYIITFDNLDPKYVRLAAFEQINNEMQSAAAYTPTILYVVGSSVTKTRLAAEKTSLQNVMKFWGDIFRPTTKVNIGYYTEKDVNWVDSAFCTQANYCPTGMSPVVSNIIRADLPRCNSALATTNSLGEPFFEQCLGKGSEEPFSRQTGPHEYSHWAQNRYVVFDDEPNWFIEGGATYFGITLGTWKNATPPKDLDSMFHSAWNMWIRQDVCPITTVNVSVVSNCMAYSDRPGTPPAPGQQWTLAQLSYYMGALATEAMIAVGGIDKYKTFVQSLASRADFDTRFLAAYGLTTESFYTKVSAYIVAMSNAGR